MRDRRIGILRRIAFTRAGQVLLRRVADHDGPFCGRKPDEQADLSERPTGGVPREPHAIRMSERRFAVVLLELLFGEDEFPVGLRVLDVAAGLVEGVDHQ